MLAYEGYMGHICKPHVKLSESWTARHVLHLQEMADQQLKQMLLAYMLLVIKDRALLQDDLDNACEDFLYKEFNHPIDYDVAAALPRLKRWGLVRGNQQVRDCSSYTTCALGDPVYRLG